MKKYLEDSANKSSTKKRDPPKSNPKNNKLEAKERRLMSKKDLLQILENAESELSKTQADIVDKDQKIETLTLQVENDMS